MGVVSGAAQNCKDVELTFQLGSLGMIFMDGGVISKVDPAGQAYLKGVRVGWSITQIGDRMADGKDCCTIVGLLVQIKGGDTDYSLTFRKRS